MTKRTDWQLIHHENVETPYFEITNGPISLCIDEEDMPFEETETCRKWAQIITDSLKIPYNIRSENKLELDQHITISVLQHEIAHLKEALQDIARQRTCAEQEADEETPIGSDGTRLGDINMGYDTIIEVAREALKSVEPQNKTV